jgi:Fe2+ or Zn2+ uptake regulation protein
MKKEALLKELAKLACNIEMHAHEFTSDEYYAEVLKTNPKATVASVRGELQRMVKDGILKIRKVKVNGSRCNAYSKS